MLIIGTLLSLLILIGFWTARGRLSGTGFDFLAWNWTPAAILVRAAAFGVLAALAVSWIFRDMRTGSLPSPAEVWMGITFGPLAEELIFRGAIFHGMNSLLRRWWTNPGWATVFTVAIAFAVSHLAKPDITPWQIVTVFATGSLYGWLRLLGGSTVPPFCAHAAYNAALLAIAFLR